MPELIEIARPGRHRAMNGRDYELTAAHLQAVADSYDPKVHEAPLVVGHPKLNAPAYGWVKGLTFDAEQQRLLAECDQVDADFAEAVTSGKLKKRSSSFYAPDAPGNPKPGAYHLRHVGFLGAVPPAMKGLRDVACFADEADEAEAVTIEFSDYTNMRALARALRGLRDFLIAEFGQEKADKALPSWWIDELQEALKEPVAAFAETADSSAQTDAPGVAGVAEGEASAPAVAAPEAAAPPAAATEAPAEAAADPPQSEAVTRREADLTERERKLQEREAKLALEEFQRREAGHLSFAEALVRTGRPLPCSREQFVAFLHRLDGVTDESVISFGEGDERTTIDFFKEAILGIAPKEVEFAELAPTDFAESPGRLSVDERAARIRTHQQTAEKDGRFISTAQAATELREANQL